MAALVVSSATGCQLLLLGGAAAAGAGAVAWHEGRLEQTLDAPLDRVYAAARATLEQDLKVPILQDRHDTLTAHLESEFADEKRINIDLELAGEERTRVIVRVGLIGIGEKDRSMRILDGIKRRSGAY